LPWWEKKGIPREGIDNYLVGEAIVLCIATLAPKITQDNKIFTPKDRRSQEKTT